MSKNESIEQYLNLVFRYHDDIYRIIVNVVREHYTAEDLTQIVMVKSWKSFKTLREPDKSKAWVKKITRNVLRDYMKSKKIYLSITDRKVFSEMEKKELKVIENDILEAVIKKEAVGTVFKALDALDEKYSDIIRKHLIAGISLKEISVEKKMNYGTVREYYSRGMRLLRDNYVKLEKGGDHDE